MTANLDVVNEEAATSSWDQVLFGSYMMQILLILGELHKKVA
jgi:hypothetical protein